MRSSFRVLVVLLVAASGNLTPLPAHANNNSFVDDDNSRFEPFLEKANAEGLIASCNPPANNRVCPDLPVTRGTMAIMVGRAIEATPSNSNHSVDDDGLGAEGYIDALLDAGVRMRCGKQHVCPDRPITRAEMATMIVDAFQWKKNANPGLYVDIRGAERKKELAALAARGGLAACDAPINRRLCPGQTVTRAEAALALITAVGLEPETRPGATTNRPRLGFGDGFDELSLWDGRSPSSSNRVTLTNGGYQGSALRVKIPRGSHYGADFHLHLEDAVNRTPEELYFRYYLKLDPDWQSRSSGKLPGFSGVYGSSGKGGYRSQTSRPGWSARLMFSPTNESDGRTWLGYYVYHLGQETRYGDGLGWNQAGRLQPGEWYCLEGQVKLNRPGIADGALRAWVDGTPAFDKSGLEFRRPNEPAIKIESFWFNVYYGGQKTTPNDLGLTIDEVIVDTDRIGCGDHGADMTVDGDFDGDGYRDRATWSDCPGGSCFWVDHNDPDGTRTTRRSGDGAWFTLDSHRLGLATGDITGNGRAEIVYYGRCDASKRCWRIHELGGRSRPPANWGDDARFSARTDSLILGDWNGDGTSDLAYRGLCGEKGRPCWRVHRSTGTRFQPPIDWGRPPKFAMNTQAADVTGDGLDDLVYIGPCDESHCWFAQVSKGDSFARPIALGLAFEDGSSGFEWIDFDGDGTSDIVSWINSTGGSWIEARRVVDRSLSDPVTVNEFKRTIREVTLRRIAHRDTVQAVVHLACQGGDTCLRQLMSPTPLRLVDSRRFLEELWNRPGGPEIS